GLEACLRAAYLCQGRARWRLSPDRRSAGRHLDSPGRRPLRGASRNGPAGRPLAQVRPARLGAVGPRPGPAERNGDEGWRRRGCFRRRKTGVRGPGAVGDSFVRPGVNGTKIHLTFGATMEKHAETQHPINDLIRRRWSPRAFAARPVEREKLLSMLE